MPDFDSRFARRFVRPTGALELMQDLGGAGPGVHMLGGGNPAQDAGSSVPADRVGVDGQGAAPRVGGGPRHREGHRRGGHAG